MKYLIFITMKVPDYDYFIELAKPYELIVHPNLKDKFWIEDCFCKIKEILHVINDEEQEIWIKLRMTDPLHFVTSKEEAIKCLESDIEEFKEYGWYLNNWDLPGYKI